MGDPAKRLATYQDILDLPPDRVGQLIAGQLHSLPRPSLAHAAVSSSLGAELVPPFRRGKGGPGGWLILDEPELHLREDVLVPDLAGWHLARVPPDMGEQPFATIAPDWVCEVLSPSTHRLDRGAKRNIYARESIGHLWLADPAARSLEILRLDGESFRVIGTFFDDACVRAEPFDAIELDLSVLWKL